MLEDFSPTRLTVARQRRGMTMRALARDLGLSDQAISSYEAGLKPPSSHTLHQIAFTLRFPLGFFTASEIDLIVPKAISFRARRSMTAELRNKALASGEIATSIISPELNRRFGFPKIDVPDLSRETSDPEVAARLLRNYWSLGQGPISNMVHLLEAKGVEVYWINDNSPSVDAVSFWRNEKPFAVLNLTKKAGSRGRYDAAHELGHLVLHRHALVVDGREIEAQADQFASAFLLPEQQFRVEAPRLPILRQYFPLKKRWGASIQAMLRRSKDIGILNPWQYECAVKELSSLGWRTNEPAELDREDSKIQSIAFERLAANQITSEVFARLLSIGTEDLHELTPLAAKYDLPVLEKKRTGSITRGGLTLWSSEDAA